MRAAAPVACVAQPMGEWVVRVVAVQTDRACELTVTVVTVDVRRVRAAHPTNPSDGCERRERATGASDGTSGELPIILPRILRASWRWIN